MPNIECRMLNNEVAFLRMAFGFGLHRIFRFRDSWLCYDVILLVDEIPKSVKLEKKK